MSIKQTKRKQLGDSRAGVRERVRERETEHERENERELSERQGKGIA